jgi:hypothetical protein
MVHINMVMIEKYIPVCVNLDGGCAIKYRLEWTIAKSGVG